MICFPGRKHKGNPMNFSPVCEACKYYKREEDSLIETKITVLIYIYFYKYINGKYCVYGNFQTGGVFVPWKPEMFEKYEMESTSMCFELCIHMDELANLTCSCLNIN